MRVTVSLAISFIFQARPLILTKPFKRWEICPVSLARGHLQEILVQSYPVIVCSDAGKLASTGGNEQCRSALLQHCRREIMSYSKMYIFFNLDKVILLMIKKIEMSRGNMVSTVNPMSEVCMLSLCVCEWVGGFSPGRPTSSHTPKTQTRGKLELLIR